MTYLVSIGVFTALILVLVGICLFVEAKVVKKGDSRIVINEDEEKSIRTPIGTTLLASLANNDIFIPSACGGGGTCGMCKCRISEGIEGFIPTELAHLSRKEKKANIHLACQLKVKDDLKIRIPEHIFNVKKYSATVLSNVNVATFIKELVLELEEGERLQFDAGAYIQIDIPEHELSYSQFRVRISERFRASWDRFNLWGLKSKVEEPIFRAYSLANPPYEDRRLSFTIRIATPPPGKEAVPTGAGSSYIFNFKEGDKVTLSGPYGDFFAKETDREMCFVGGGAGMAPLRSHIFNQLETVHTQRPMSFWYGARSIQELFFEGEFKRLEEKYENFSYNVALSQPEPDDHWEGLTGYIHECLLENYLAKHADPTEIEYYLCGPPMMVDAVEAMLDNMGVEPEMIAYDKF